MMWMLVLRLTALLQSGSGQNTGLPMKLGHNTSSRKAPAA
ncbi:MAG: hypothetical protein RL685_4108, partial [Pseudomonadota bacterium]